MTCPHCGSRMVGDGYTTPIHCEQLLESQQDDLESREPDAAPLFCAPHV